MVRFIVLALIFGVVLLGVGYLVKIGVERTSRDLARADRVSDDIDTLLGARHVEYLQRGKNAAVQMELVNVKSALIMFHMNKGRYPESIEELVNEGYIDRAALSDAWFQEYRYEIADNVLVVTSPGADRIKNTADDIREEISLR